jgi:hypothetical protein
MGAVIMFPEARRAVRDEPICMRRVSATVIILPVIRIVREGQVPAGAATDTTKTPSGRKRRRPAARP